MAYPIIPRLISKKENLTDFHQHYPCMLVTVTIVIQIPCYSPSILPLKIFVKNIHQCHSSFIFEEMHTLVE